MKTDAAQIEFYNSLKSPVILNSKAHNDDMIAFEYLDEGNLSIKLKLKRVLDMKLLAVQISLALLQLHQKKIIHGDIKPSVFFMGKDNVIKLADFGSCRFIDDSGYTQGKRGTITYMAPEIIRGEPYNLKADIYSLGVLFYYMITL
jgi:serine/threonine protein kinase